MGWTKPLSSQRFNKYYKLQNYRCTVGTFCRIQLKNDKENFRVRQKRTKHTRLLTLYEHNNIIPYEAGIYRAKKALDFNIPLSFCS